MVGLLSLHIGGALKHHFVDRDSVLRGIIWPS
jgi:cytochrome b561